MATRGSVCPGSSRARCEWRADRPLDRHLCDGPAVENAAMFGLSSAHLPASPPPTNRAPQFHQLRHCLPDDRPPWGRRATNRDRHAAGNPANIGSVPAPKLPPKVLKGVARFQQTACTQWLSPRNGERKSDLTKKPPIARIRERRSLGAHPFHVSRVSAPAPHWPLVLFACDACF